jgi:hypothetical protein
MQPSNLFALSLSRADHDMKGAGMKRMETAFLAITAVAMVAVMLLLGAWCCR